MKSSFGVWNRGRIRARVGTLSAIGCAGLWLTWTGGCGGGTSTKGVSTDKTPALAPPDTMASRIFSLEQDTVLKPLLAEWPKSEVKHDRAHPDDSAGDQEEVTMVYRVQLYTTKDLGTAQAVSKEAKTDFKQDVQIDFEVPYYKVRVGAFASPQAAEPLLQDARRLGYRGAWAVRVRASEHAP